MLDKQIAALSFSFSKQWNDSLKNFPRYFLDYSWPSLGTLDALLEPIRFKATVDDIDTSVMLGAASYLAVMWYGIWSACPDKPEVSAEYREDPRPQIRLSIRGGKYLSKEQEMSIELLPVFWEIVRYPLNPFGYFGKTALELGTPFQRVPLFAIGLFCGYSPYFEGPWKDKDDIEILDYLAWVNSALAENTANYYRHLYLMENYGQESSVYLDSLILPPPGHRQVDFISRPVFRLLSLHKSLKDDRVQQSKIEKWIENLASLPNDCLSLPALTALLALNSEISKDKVTGLIASHRGLVNVCHPALEFGRTCLGISPSPEAAHLEGKPHFIRSILQQEIEFGILPWMFLSAEELSALNLPSLFHALSTQEFSLAADLISRNAQNRELWHIQAGLYYCLANRRDAVELILTHLRDGDFLEFGREQLFLEASYFCLIENYQRVFDLIEPLLGLENEDDAVMPSSLIETLLVRHFFSACFALKKPDIIRTLAYKRIDPSRLDAALSHDLLEVLSAQEDEPLRKEIFDRLLSIAPNDPRTIQALAITRLAKDSADLQADQ